MSFTYRESRDLTAAFEVGQNAVDLPAKFTVRHVGIPVNLAASFEGQTSVNLPAKFVIRRSASQNLRAGFDAQASASLPAEFVVRHAEAVDLLGGFVIRQGIGDISARTRVERIYDLRRTAGIAFYWQGADNPPESLVDFIVESPTGFWVTKFYDGPARLRYVFIPWTTFAETGLDGTRPDKSQVDGFIWTVHSDGLRRIDYIHAPLFGDLLGKFIVRQERSVDLLTGFIVRHEGFIDLPAKFDMMIELLMGVEPSSTYNLCVTPPEFITVQPASIYTLCIRQEEYLTVSPASVYSLAVA